MITILSWLWHQKKSRTRYEAEHVNVWANMLRRHVSVEHRLACVTDIPEGIDDSIEIIPLPDPWGPISNRYWSVEKGRPQCYRRLDMFRPDAADIYGERFLSMDLDCVIFRNIDKILQRPEDFVMMRSGVLGRPYNGSMLLMTAGARPKVFRKFSAANAERANRNRHIGSDQAWIGFELGPNEAKFGQNDGAYFYRKGKHVPAAARILFFPGETKPWHAPKHLDQKIIDGYR